MQQQMLDQFHQPMMMMFEGFAALHREQAASIREEFEHVVKGRGSKFSQIARRQLEQTTYEQFMEDLQVEIATAEEMGTTDRTWTLSASLWPRGRSSTERDWRYLGEMLSAINAPLDSCITPLEKTHPNDVHYWIWEERPDDLRASEGSDQQN